MLKEFIPKSVSCFKEGYTFFLFKKDLFAGLTVGIVALPLALAFAIASGVGPERGLYTAIIAGFLISFLGGSRVQIGGPTGAFVVVVYDIISRQGYEGLVVATLIASVMLIVLGIARLGNLIKYVPYPLVTGFTTGIAVVIFSTQMKGFFGFQIENVPSNFIGQWHSYFIAFPTFHGPTLLVASSTLAMILLIKRYFVVLPWGVLAIVLSTFVCFAFNIPVATVASHFGELPRSLPSLAFPQFSLAWEDLTPLMHDAITIALLAGIESLLSASIADGMTGFRHRSNCELIAQGIANFGSALFGGIPATGAIARTATNVKTGARTPVAGMIHAVVLFLILLYLGPIVSLVPLPALSAVLVMVAWNMSEVNHFYRLLKAPLGDVAILLTAFFLTVFVDITVAVELGMILAAFLFIKRIVDYSKIAKVSSLLENEEEVVDKDALSDKDIPSGVAVYEINGPFFFGIADNLNDVLHHLERPPKVFILRMRYVPAIDTTGIYVLQQFYSRCAKERTHLILSGVRGKAAESINKYGIATLVGIENIFPHIDAALQHANTLLTTK
ncbi:MAG: sulfate permease [Chlamydiota bacterium]